jgi:hypothetical protein
MGLKRGTMRPNDGASTITLANDGYASLRGCPTTGDGRSTPETGL